MALWELGFREYEFFFDKSRKPGLPIVLWLDRSQFLWRIGNAVIVFDMVDPSILRPHQQVRFLVVIKVTHRRAGCVPSNIATGEISNFLEDNLVFAITDSTVITVTAAPLSLNLLILGLG